MSISVAPLGSFGSKLRLNTAALPKLDAEFESITEGGELTKKEKLKTTWAALEALVDDPKRIALPLRVAGGVGIRPVQTGKCG